MTTEYTVNRLYPKPDFDTRTWHDQMHRSLDMIDADTGSFFESPNLVVEAWTAGHAYIVNDKILDRQRNQLFLCEVPHTSGSDFLDDRNTHPTYWSELGVPMIPRGQWANNVVYNTFDHVYDSALGVVALCSIGHTSVLTGDIKSPSEIGNWIFVVDNTLLIDTAEASADAAAASAAEAAASAAQLESGVVFEDLFQFKNENGQTQFEVENVGAAVNNWRVQGALINQGPVMVVVGGNTNADGHIATKGTGGFFVGNGNGQTLEVVSQGVGATANSIRLRSGIAGAPAGVVVTGEANASLDVFAKGLGTVNIGPQVNYIPFAAIQVPNSGPNYLDDYEEGIWTPDLTFGGLKVGITYSFTTAGYVKIGRLVFFTMYLGLTSKGSSVGNALISGLPFTLDARLGSASCMLASMTAGVGDTHIVANTINASSTMRIVKITAGTTVVLTDADFTNGSFVNISGHYGVA